MEHFSFLFSGSQVLTLVLYATLTSVHVIMKLRVTCMKEAHQLQDCSSGKITASQNGSIFAHNYSPCSCPPPFPHKSTVKKWEKAKIIFFSVASGCRGFILLLVQLGAQTDTGSRHLPSLNAVRCWLWLPLVSHWKPVVFQHREGGCFTPDGSLQGSSFVR